MDNADAGADADGDEINAAACGWSWGCSANPIVTDAAVVTVTLLNNDTVAKANANVSNTSDVIRMILDALMLFIPLLNIVATDVLSLLNPPAKRNRNIIKMWIKMEYKQIKAF